MFAGFLFFFFFFFSFFPSFYISQPFSALFLLFGPRQQSCCQAGPAYIWGLGCKWRGCWAAGDEALVKERHVHSLLVASGALNYSCSGDDERWCWKGWVGEELGSVEVGVGWEGGDDWWWGQSGCWCCVCGSPCGPPRNHLCEQRQDGLHGPGGQRDPGPGWHAVPGGAAWGPSRPHLPHRGLSSSLHDALAWANQVVMLIFCLKACPFSGF